MNEEKNSNKGAIFEQSPSKMKYKLPIVTIAVIALALKILDISSIFTFYNPLNNTLTTYKLTPYMPPVITLILNFIDLLPFILFLFYVLKFYNKDKAEFLLPLLFAINAAGEIYVVSFAFFDALDYVKYVIVAVMCLLLLVGSMCKKYNRQIMCIALVVLIAVMLISFLITVPMYINMNDARLFSEGGYIFTMLSSFATYLAAIAFYVSMLLLVLKNKISVISKIKSKK